MIPRHRKALQALLMALGLHGVTHAASTVDPREGQTQPLVTDELLATQAPPSATLRGDWETEGAVVLAYDRAWRDALKTLISTASGDGPVYLLTNPRDRETLEFQDWAGGLKGGEVISVASNSPWVRDYGPLELAGPAGSHWVDLAYLPEARPADDALPTTLGRLLGRPVRRSRFYLEGGGLVSNGTGLCALTEGTLAQAEVPLDQPVRVRKFLGQLGCSVLVRLPGLPAEATQHADMMLQFLADDVVALSTPVTRGPNDAALLAVLSEARQRLVQGAERLGVALQVVELPLTHSGATYFSFANSLRTAHHLFVPRYKQVASDLEGAAHAALARALPGVEVVPVEADTMIDRGGALHCLAVTLRTDRTRPPKAAR